MYYYFFCDCDIGNKYSLSYEIKIEVKAELVYIQVKLALKYEGFVNQNF